MDIIKQPGKRFANVEQILFLPLHPGSCKIKLIVLELVIDQLPCLFLLIRRPPCNHRINFTVFHIGIGDDICGLREPFAFVVFQIGDSLRDQSLSQHLISKHTSRS